MTKWMMTQEGPKTIEMGLEILWIQEMNLRIHKIHMARVWPISAMRTKRVAATWQVGCLELALGIWRFFR